MQVIVIDDELLQVDVHGRVENCIELWRTAWRKNEEVENLKIEDIHVEEMRVATDKQVLHKILLQENRNEELDEHIWKIVENCNEFKVLLRRVQGQTKENAVNSGCFQERARKPATPQTNLPQTARSSASKSQYSQAANSRNTRR